MSYLQEQLPLSNVHWSFTFYGFSKNKTSKIYFCSCIENALYNYCLQQEKLKKEQGAYYYVNWRCGDIPNGLQNDKLTYIDVFPTFKYKPDICHFCRKVIPSPAQGHGDIYQSPFYQRFGAYIEQRKWHYNVFSWDPESILNEEIRELITVDSREFLIDYQNWNQKLKNFPYEHYIKKYNLKLDESGHYFHSDDPEHDITMKTATKMFSIIDKEKRRINKIVENEIRANFGYKLVGERFVNETTLNKLLCQMWPNLKIIHHAKPDHLEGQEYDIFIPDKKLAIEYQGIQHFEPISAWDGEDGLARTQERDLKKLRKAEKAGITIIYFYYNEEISTAIILNKLNNLLNN